MNKHHLHIELTPEEYQELCTKAKTARLSKRLFLVRLIQEQTIHQPQSSEIAPLRTEIHHIGNNINQIARNVNGEIATKEDISHCKLLMEKVYRLMYEIAKPK